MTIIRNFQAKLDLNSLVTICDSLGCHIASKLFAFGSDERTLTEELVDMLALWSQAFPPTSGSGFDVSIRKLTQTEEWTSGADLRLSLVTPEGMKRIHVQAKVLEPSLPGLRGGKAALSRLRGQLKKIRSQPNTAGFAMIYQPSSELAGSFGGIDTWEQGARSANPQGVHSRFGVSLISVDDLLKSNNAYRYRPGISYMKNGNLRPQAVSFTQLLLELLVCERGKWLKDADAPVHHLSEIRPFMDVEVGIAMEMRSMWQELQGEARSFLSGVRDGGATGNNGAAF